MPDETEPYRPQRLAELNAETGSREALEAQYGQVWSTETGAAMDDSTGAREMHDKAMMYDPTIDDVA
jgi:hypothetical protein